MNDWGEDSTAGPLRGLREAIAVTPSPEEWASFRAYARVMMARSYPLVGLFVALAVSIWWPLDALVFPASAVRETYAELRLTVLAATLFASGLLAWVPALRRHPAPFAVASLAGISGLTAWFMGLTGDLDGPWFHFLYGCPMLTVPLVVSLGRRTLSASVIAFAVWAGYVIGSPGALHHPLHLASVSFLVFGTLLAVLIGHLGHIVVRSNFVHRNRLAREERGLRELNERLGHLVDERTAELRRLTQHVQRVREDERRWLARELHDELGQELAALRYAIAVAEHTGRRDPSLLPGQLEEARASLDRIASTARRILNGLRPAALDEMGAVAALRWFADEINERGELSVELEISPEDLQLDDERGTAVFRIVQEALTNIIRHARASHAVIRLARGDEGLSLTVADDGIGMNGAASRKGKGLGLVSIRERAHALGGSAAWVRPEEGGTRLEILVPAEAQAQGDLGRSQTTPEAVRT